MSRPTTRAAADDRGSRAPAVPRFTAREVVLSLLRDARREGVSKSEFAEHQAGYGSLRASVRDEVLASLIAEGLAEEIVGDRDPRHFGLAPTCYRLKQAKGGTP